jgi:uridine kinase
MKIVFEPKRLIEIDEANAGIGLGEGYIAQCEAGYEERVAAVAGEIAARGCAIVMLSGPSASGKTTSANKLALELRQRGGAATVVSLDNFFRNVENYPKTKEGVPDFEHLMALDVDMVNACLKELSETGRCEIPTYDFISQRRAGRTELIETGGGATVIIEGIHALNPLLSQSISDADIFRLYVGLRMEYGERGRRVIATRDLRIARRLVRDYYFRGHSVRNTLELWNRLRDGEERWIKPFKSDADMLLDTSFPYEPGLFAPILSGLCADPEQGGEFRDTLFELSARFEAFSAVDAASVPPGSMLREFIGGLRL